MAAGASTPWSSQPVAVSDHARQRWAERTDADVDIISGWCQAEPLIAGYRTGWSGDEYRVHETEAVVLARRDTTLVTVLDLKGEDAERWLREAVHAEFGAVWQDAHGGGRR